jgi:hypothetical protein
MDADTLFPILNFGILVVMMGVVLYTFKKISGRGLK